MDISLSIALAEHSLSSFTKPGSRMESMRASGFALLILRRGIPRRRVGFRVEDEAWMCADEAPCSDDDHADDVSVGSILMEQVDLHSLQSNEQRLIP